MKVYRIDRISIKGNEYGLAREEKWKIEADSDFETLKDAEDYVLKMNRSHHAVDLNLSSLLNETDILERCVYDEKWVHRRTYFLGYPPIESIKKLLSKDGIHLKPDHPFVKPKV